MLLTCAMANPRRGFTKYWATKPHRIVHGLRAILRKSSNVSVRPIESMRRPRPRVKRSELSHVT